MSDETVRELLVWKDFEDLYSTCGKWRVGPQWQDTGFPLSYGQQMMGSGYHPTMEEAKALAQRLQDDIDGVPMLDIPTLNSIVDDFVSNAAWDVRDTYKSVGEHLRDAIVERISQCQR